MKNIRRFIPGAAIIVLLLGLVMLLSFGPVVEGQEPAPPSPLPEAAVAASCEAAEQAFADGDAMGGCIELLDALRSLDLSQAEQMDVTIRPLHLLTFGMAALMDDEALHGFLTQTLDPSAHPIDDAVLLQFHILYRNYLHRANVPPLSLPQMVQLAMRMSESPHAMVRAGGFMALSWHVLDNNVSDANRDALNRLAEMCPDALVTREILHRQLMVASYSGRANELIAQPDWVPAVQALLARDPVATFLIETEAVAQVADESATGGPVRAEDLAPVLEAARNHPDAQVRDWCLWRLEHVLLREVPQYSALGMTVASYCKSVAFPESDKTAENGVTPGPVEVVRAQRILLTHAIRARDADTCRRCVDALFAAEFSEEPFDTNYYEVQVTSTFHSAMAFAVWGSYAEAIPMFERIALKYPKSFMGTEFMNKADFFRTVLQRNGQ